MFFRETVPTMQRLNWHSWSCASVSSPSAHRSGVRGASPLVACGVFAARCFVVQLLEHFGGAELGFGLPQLLQSLCLQVCGGERDVRGSPSETRRPPVERRSSFTNLCSLAWLPKACPRPFPWWHKEKVAFAHFQGANWNATKCFFFFFFSLQRTSACPGPGCWWSGSSGRWWTPARSAAAALCPGPPESSRTLEFFRCLKSTAKTNKAKKAKQRRRRSSNSCLGLTFAT